MNNFFAKNYQLITHFYSSLKDCLDQNYLCVLEKEDYDDENLDDDCVPSNFLSLVKTSCDGSKTVLVSKSTQEDHQVCEQSRSWNVGKSRSLEKLFSNLKYLISDVVIDSNNTKIKHRSFFSCMLDSIQTLDYLLEDFEPVEVQRMINWDLKDIILLRSIQAGDRNVMQKKLSQIITSNGSIQFSYSPYFKSQISDYRKLTFNFQMNKNAELTFYHNLRVFLLLISLITNYLLKLASRKGSHELLNSQFEAYLGTLSTIGISPISEVMYEGEFDIFNGQSIRHSTRISSLLSDLQRVIFFATDESIFCVSEADLIQELNYLASMTESGSQLIALFNLREEQNKFCLLQLNAYELFEKVSFVELSDIDLNNLQDFIIKITISKMDTRKPLKKWPIFQLMCMFDRNCFVRIEFLISLQSKILDYLESRFSLVTIQSLKQIERDANIIRGQNRDQVILKGCFEFLIESLAFLKMLKQMLVYCNWVPQLYEKASPFNKLTSKKIEDFEQIREKVETQLKVQTMQNK